MIRSDLPHAKYLADWGRVVSKVVFSDSMDFTTSGIFFVKVVSQEHSIDSRLELPLESVEKFFFFPLKWK